MEELIFTSSSRGLQVGKSGFCTVAATAGMTPGLIRMLESLSGYRHLFPPGTPEAARNPVAYSYVKAKVGNDFRYVLSRVKDCGVDYSGRSNKIAHHLSLPGNMHASSPTRTLLEKKFFVDQWDQPAQNLPPRTLPGKYSKPLPCSVWQKVTGDAGWAGELVESCQMNKIVYLVVKPSTPVIGMIHQALSLLPASQQWQYTFCTFYRQMPPNVECQIRCVMEKSPEIELTRQSSNNVLIDLTKPLGKSLSCWAENARHGTLIEGQRPVVESLPTAAALARQKMARQALPSAMPDLRSPTKKGPPGLQNRKPPPEEELDVLEIEPTPLWKRALVASAVALVLAGITSVVVYPDMYKGLFSGKFFSFNSGPRVSQFASERPKNAPAPKPKIDPETQPANENRADDPALTPVAPLAGPNPDTANGTAIANAPATDSPPSQTGVADIADSVPVDDETASNESRTAETPARTGSRRNENNGAKLVAPALPRSMRPPSQGRTRKSRRLQQELPGQKSVTTTTRTTSDAPTGAPTGPLVTGRDPVPRTPLTTQPPPPKQTLIRLESLEAVSFSPNWDLIESTRASIPVIVARHPQQTEMGIRLEIQDSQSVSDTAPSVSSRQITPRQWEVAVSGRPVGQFNLVDSDLGSQLEFRCATDAAGKVEALADDLEAINHVQLRLEYADKMATVFPLDIRFVRGHIGLDNKRRNNDVMFEPDAFDLKALLADDSLDLVYDVHSFSGGDSAGRTTDRPAMQMETISGRSRQQTRRQSRDGDSVEQETVTTRIEFPLDLGKTAFDKFSTDQEIKLSDLNARLTLEIYKPLNKPLRYRWAGFIVDAPGFPGVELQSWRFSNHPISVIRRDYAKRKSALRASGTSPTPSRPRQSRSGSPDDNGAEQLLEIVKAEIEFLDDAYKRTAKTTRIDEIMPGRVPHPVEIHADGMLMLMYIDMGDVGKQWSIADMKQAYHGSPIE